MKIIQKSVSVIVGVLLAGATLTSCVRDENSPGYEYMPDMYRSPAVEAYVDYGEVRDTLRYGVMQNLSARHPVAGTVPMSEQLMNDMPYPYANNIEGYERAGEFLKSPLAQTEANISEGQSIYISFCVHCHGAEGAGNGAVVAIGGHPAPGAYNGALKDLEEGKMFHTLTYGKGVMGSHASQLTKEERWKVLCYVKTLQNPSIEAPADTLTTTIATTVQANATAAN